MKKLRFVTRDVHAETIAVAVTEANGEVRSLGVIPNRAESIGRLVGKLGKPEAGVLRSGPDWLRAVLATERTGREVRRGRSDAGTGEDGRSSEDRPA